MGYKLTFLLISEIIEKAMAPEFIKVPEKVTAREHESAKFLVKVIGEPKPSGGSCGCQHNLGG